MTIAEQVTRLKQDFDAVYEAGKSAGGGGDTEAAYQQGVVDGKQAEYDRFWDAYQQNGNRSTYNYAFSYGFWTDEIYNPKYPINGTGGTGVDSAFLRNDSITDTKVPITVSGTSTSVFYNCRALKRIPKLIFSGATNINSMFNNCDSLEELYCEGEIPLSISFAQSKLLTNESVQSVIDCLKDLTGTTAQTLTLATSVIVNLTEEQMQTIANKNWNM